MNESTLRDTIFGLGYMWRQVSGKHPRPREKPPLINGNKRRIDDRYRLRRIKDRVGRISTRGRLTRRVTQTDFERTLRLGL